MEEYTQFCDDESSEKSYAITTAGKAIDGYKVNLYYLSYYYIEMLCIIILIRLLT